MSSRVPALEPAAWRATRALQRSKPALHEARTADNCAGLERRTAVSAGGPNAAGGAASPGAINTQSARTGNSAAGRGPQAG